MTARILKLTCVAVLALPALAFGATFDGHGTSDSKAKVSFRTVRHDGKRFVTDVVANNLRYRNGKHHCTSSGRTPREPMIEGEFRVQGDGDFLALGGTAPRNPLAAGELKVRGEIHGSTASGTVVFTFGKNGCRTGRVRWQAD